MPIPSIQLGAYSFGDALRNDDLSPQPSHEAMTKLLDTIQHADRAGLEFFAVGEHHTSETPASAPGTIIAAAAATTKQIVLSSGASIIGTDDPVRVFQQFATADAFGGGGRVEVIAGRGSSVETFPLFGFDLQEYDELFAERLGLLLAINEAEGPRVTWSGRTRPALDDLEVVPRPVHGRLPIWVATGGNPHSALRTGQMGLPLSFGIIGGTFSRFSRQADLYRRAAAQAGHGPERTRVSVASFGLVAPTKKEALDRYYPGWYAINVDMGRLRGWAAPDAQAYVAQAHGEGAYIVGDPDDVAERIVDAHRHLGHERHFLQMDLGGVATEHVKESITLMATEVRPRVERLLARAA